MAKKYEQPDEEPMMASEPIGAYKLSNEYHSSISVITHEDDDDIDIDDIVFDDNKFYIPDDELRRLGRECINAPSVSADEAMRRLRAVCL